MPQTQFSPWHEKINSFLFISTKHYTFSFSLAGKQVFWLLFFELFHYSLLPEFPFSLFLYSFFSFVDLVSMYFWHHAFWEIYVCLSSFGVLIVICIKVFSSYCHTLTFETRCISEIGHYLKIKEVKSEKIMSEYKKASKNG